MDNTQTAKQVPRSTTRTDIQWMRALAVGLVLFYHLWPHRLSGGFIGVDIFFVISGFLITTNLLRKPPQSWRDILDFWGRRVRRLLPVAFTVILVTLALVRFIAPPTQWISHGRGAITSALYVQNWELVSTSVDYLAAQNPPTAYQHYWSLSVEEQFYLIWPLLIVLTGVLARHLGLKFRLIAGWGILGVTVGSFISSIVVTYTNPAIAYFTTYTRMWELGAGGTLAVVYPIVQTRLSAHPHVKEAGVVIGVVAMVASSFLLTGAHFPGWIAAVPILGAVLVIACGPTTSRLSLDRILGLRPFQFLGDISYSIYLWHWPIIIAGAWFLGHSLTWSHKLAAIALVILLAWGSKTWIEDRFRGLHPLGEPLRRTWIFLIIGMLFTSSCGVGLLAYTSQATQKPAFPSTATCVGADARLDPQCTGDDPHGSELYISPIHAMEDKSIAYADKCWWLAQEPDRYPTCRYGALSSKAPKIAIFGNSHAGPYVEPLVTISHRHGWGLRTYLASRCQPSLLPLYIPEFPRPHITESCLDFTTSAIEDMKLNNVQVVVMSVFSQSVGLKDVPQENDLEMKYDMNRDLLQIFLENDIQVVVIKDVPYLSHNIADCVSTNLSDLSRCDDSRSLTLLPDPLYDAALDMKDTRITALDFSDTFCDESSCFSVVGGVIIYFDQGHMTTTFANTLTPYLEPVLVEKLG
ncbi:MAG: acyltransferase [Propionibacteriaceae bacterium]|nr:acyltransferase [Propionibacteriaceae bacterium]